MLSCDQVAREVERFSRICYKYQESFNSEDKQFLLILANHAIINRPIFTAAGFFEINRSTIFALFGTLGTYFFVVLQFNQK